MSKELLALEITKLYFSNQTNEYDIVVFSQKFISYYQKVLSSMI